MKNRMRVLNIIIIGLAAIAFVIGIVFIQQGYAKEAWLVQAMKQEQIEMSNQPGVIVDNAKLAQSAADLVREHRHSIAPTYGDLLGGERYNPSDTKQLTYSQAMNIENYLYLSVTAFGVFTMVKAVGAFMVVTAIALGFTGYALWHTAKQ